MKLLFFSLSATLLLPIFASCADGGDTDTAAISPGNSAHGEAGGGAGGDPAGHPGAGSPAAGGGGESGAGTAGASGGAAGASGGAGAPATLTHPSGSFLLHLDSIKQYPFPSEMFGPSWYGRLDVQAVNDGYVAFVSFVDGTTGSFSVAVAPDRLTLTGAVSQGESPASSESEWFFHWGTLVLPRAATGALAGTFTATGQARAFDGGDSGGNFPGQGSGTLEADTAAPVFTPTMPTRKGPPGALLPWESLEIHTSEPVPGASLTAATGATLEGAPLAISTSLLPLAPDDGVGVRILQAFSPAWEQTRGHQLSISVQSGIHDPAGNLSAAVTADFPVLDVGSAAASVALDGTVPFGRWGTGALLPAGAPCEADAGCLSLGLADLTCPVPVAGVAARVLIAGASVVKVRLRVQNSMGGGAAPFSLNLTDKAGHVIVIDAATLVYPPAAAKTDTGNTAWATFSFPFAGVLEGDEIGVDLVAGRPSVKTDCIWPLPSGKAEVLVSRIWADKE